MKTKFSGILTLFLAFVVQLTFAQEKTISGVVSDDQGMPLPAATVLVKGTSNGTSTDFDGNYSITANAGDVLVFSYVGYANKEVAVAASNSISVTLQPDNTLDEVVVTALGIKRKQSEITTANQNVKSEELTQAANPNVVQSLTGKVSGLQINTTSNGVNPNSKVTIRGNNSISGDNSALVVIDGVISNLSVLNNLPPEIIESVNVIKGVQGAALYGDAAANGLITVTTKGGSRKENVSVTFNTSTQFQTVNFVPERQTKYGQGWNGEHINYENGGWGPEFDGSLQPVGLPQEDGTYKMFPYSSLGNDHIKDFFQTGKTFQNSVSVQGGGENGSVLLSLTNVDTEFVVQDDKLRRTTAFFKADRKFGKFTASAAATYYTSSQSNTSAGLFTDLLQTASNIPVTEFSNPKNQYHWTSYYNSPYWLRDNVRGNSSQQVLSAVASLGYELNDNISFLYRASMRYRSLDNLNYTNAYTDQVKIGGGDHTVQSSLSVGDQGVRDFYGDLFANFDYMLTDDISFKANVGFNTQDYRATATSVSGNGLTIPGFYNVSNLTGTPEVSNSEVRTRQVATFGNFDLGYKDYLFLNLTGRYQSRSQLDPSVAAVFYPSAGVSFIPTKAIEGLKSKTLNNLKVYANVSSVARSTVGAYAVNDLYVQPTGFAYGNLNSFTPSRSITDPLLKNEDLFNVEFGFNLGLLNDKITLDFSYYDQTTTDAQFTTTPSFASGASSARINVGEIKTNGFEIDLGFTPINNREKGIKWTNRLSFETNKTVVNKIDGVQNQINLQSGESVGIFAEVGEEFPLIKGTAYERDGQGRVIIDPTTGNPLKSSEFQKLGVNNPDFIIGFNSVFEFKGFKLAATMDYRTGHEFWAGNKDWLSWSGHLVESAENGRRGFIFPNSSVETSPGSGVYTANTGTVTGGTTYTSFLNYYSNEYRDVAENFVLDATAFKVRELALSYTFDGSKLQNMGIKGLTVGVNATNPFVVLPKENRGYHDPEFANTTGNASGLATTGAYPATRTFGMNVNLTF